jgi:predicted O-linked N-acetylglucosamine transferase (SPINDLY family)
MTTSATLQQPEPQAIEDALRQAIAHHQAGQLEDAAKRYLALLQIQPNHPEANYHLGILAVQTNHFAAALPYFNTALDADPTRGQFWLGYIDALSQAGQQEDARQVLALARQQGLQGDEVEALAARLDSAKPPEQSTTGHPRASSEAVPVASAKKSTRHKKKQPSPRELDTLFAAFREGRYAEVVTLARTMTEQFPQHEFGWKTLGVVYMQLGRHADALEPMKKAAALSPNDVEVHYNLGVTLQGLDRLQEAEASYRRALRINPHYADALCNLGVVLHNLGHQEEAEKSLRKAIRIRPDYAEAHNNLSTTLKDLGRLDEAEASCRQALQLQPLNAAAHSNLGNILQTLGRLDEAEASYRRALEINPNHAEAHRNLGNVLRETDCLAEAEASFRQALRINPDDAGTHNNLGITLQGLGRLDEADAHLQLALHINPDDATTHDNRGKLLCYLGRLNEAEASYRKALQIAPNDAGIHLNLGKVLMHLIRRDEAEACFRRALEISPHDIEIHNNLGLALQDQGHLEEAETCYRSILRTHPDNAGAITNLGHILLSLGRSDEAEACFRKALLANPDHAPLHSNLLYFLLLSSTADKKSIFSEHAGFGEQFEPRLRGHWPEHTQSRDPERCLQIGFVSADLYNHAVASFVEPVLTHLSDCPHLSLHAYYSHVINDPVTQRLRGRFAHWNPVYDMSDAELAEKIRADGIDILIDLSGHTAGNRLLTFARKPAPVQASWVGYPGTTGMHAIDYYLGDRFFLPPGQFEGQFTEKIVYLPANAPYLPIKNAPPVNALPALSNSHTTFGSFNRSNKLSREVIALWSQLLRALPNSRMLLGGMPRTSSNDTLVVWFAEEGIERSRLDFYPRSDMGSYLRLHQQVDICLDTFPYNGGTTTLHALWMGVPTLTLAGSTAAGRSGASILGHAGLESFVAHDATDFMKKGLFWAGNLAELSDIRAGLRERFAKSARGQPAVVTAGVERALRMMWQRWCANLPAESFEVSLQDIGCSLPEARP